ncbi:MAG TPA: hypothetical protein VGK32_21885 [Vicinamibacterales bacterium]|jgi:hypothetical protein
MISDDVQRVDAYREASARYASARDVESRRSRWVSYMRLAAFLGGAAAVVSALSAPAGGVLPRLALGAGGFMAFVVLVSWHGRIEARERWLGMLAQVNAESAARVDRDWEHLPPAHVAGPGPDHAFAGDLDLFGRASLFELLGSVGTEAGRLTLADWLIAPAPPDVVRARQQAVAELAALTTLREEFAALGRLVEPSRHDLEVFFRWAEGGPWLRRRTGLLWSIRFISASTLVLIGLHASGLTERPLWLYPLAVALAFVAVLSKRARETFQRAFSRDRLFQQHSTLFARMADAPLSSAKLQQLQSELGRSSFTAAREMKRLASIRQYADARFVPLFHFVLAIGLLWDFHVLDALERWQARTAGHLRRWFDALGEFDALCALAALTHDNPGWAMPEILEQGDRLTAHDIGHPLISSARRVSNDVTVGPRGSALLVTGSNMSGKSTLLRAIGLNVVLAQAGGPVCATRMTLPPLAVCTSMRVQDSLEAGVSYFMAALGRLKLVVSAADGVEPGDPALLYLLDEILQGTNTAERQVAVRRVLAHLLQCRAIGAVTTHDLELAACEELASACEAVHFTEGVERHDEGVRLSFDYKLRPGVATSRNALKLLELVGLATGSRPSSPSIR